MVVVVVVAAAAAIGKVRHSRFCAAACSLDIFVLLPHVILES